MAFVSVDGGATKTMAACYDKDGNIRGVSASGPSNFRNIGTESAASHIRDAVKSSMERSGLHMRDIEKITFALAGVKDSRKSTDIIEAFIAKLEFRLPYNLLNDGEAGYNCRFFHGNGIIAAPGTGMIAYGKSSGRFERASGWGWLIGDEGGAFYIGRRALQEAAKIADGRATGDLEFLESIMTFFNVQEPRQLVNEVYTTPVDIRRIASIAKLVSDQSVNGSAKATEILEEAASEAGKCVVALKRKLNDNSLEVSGYGGVYRAGNVYWNKLKDTVMISFPDTVFRDPLYGYHAVLGSIYLVLDEEGNKDIDTGRIEADFNRKVDGMPREEKERYLFL